MRNLVAALAGAVFAVGLGVSGMTLPQKVIGFLDFAGDWDPALAFVMGGAVTVYGVLFQLARRRPRPVFAGRFRVPTRRDLTPKLVLGSVMFGAGWGLGGFCPGPALASIGTATSSVIVFVLAMLVGMFGHTLYSRWEQRRTRQDDVAASVVRG